MGSTDLFCVCDLLHEAGVFLYAGDAKCLCFGTDSVYEIVIVDGARWLEGTERRGVWEGSGRSNRRKKIKHL